MSQLNDELMKKNKNKNVVIILLVIAVILLTIYVLFSKMDIIRIDKNENFLRDTVALQNSVSMYIGMMYSDTFAIYNKAELITGKAKDGKEIKNNKDKAITPLVDTEIKIEKSGTTCYEISEKNAKELLKIDLPKYEGLKWYIQDGEMVRINYENKPSWWSSDFDVLLVGSK